MGSTTKVTSRRSTTGPLLVVKDAATDETVRVMNPEPKPRPSEPVYVGNPKPGRANILLILQDASTGRVEKIVEAQNVVTIRGNQFYAERSAGQTPTWTFQSGRFVVASSYRVNEAPTTNTYGNFVLTTFSGTQAFDGGYPKTSDTDTDNTGSGATVVTWRRTYTTAQANITIRALGICRAGATTTAAVSLRYLLNYITLSTAQRVTKTASQTLKAFINHTMLGT